MDENFLRGTLLFQIVIQSGLSLYFLRRTRIAPSLLRREEGAALSALLGLSYFGYIAGIIAYLLNPAWMAWGAVPNIAPVWRGLGIVLLVAGTVLAMWALKTLGINFAFSVAPREQGTLIRSGPYRFVRHPLYTAGLVEAVGISLIMASWFVGMMTLLLWTGLFLRTPLEEAKLMARFGQSYRDYMAVTGCFLPRISFFKPNTILG